MADLITVAVELDSEESCETFQKTGSGSFSKFKSCDSKKVERFYLLFERRKPDYLLLLEGLVKNAYGKFDAPECQILLLQDPLGGEAAQSLRDCALHPAPALHDRHPVARDSGSLQPPPLPWR